MIISELCKVSLSFPCYILPATNRKRELCTDNGLRFDLMALDYLSPGDKQSKYNSMVYTGVMPILFQRITSHYALKSFFQMLGYYFWIELYIHFRNCQRYEMIFISSNCLIGQIGDNQRKIARFCNQY